MIASQRPHHHPQHQPFQLSFIDVDSANAYYSPSSSSTSQAATAAAFATSSPLEQAPRASSDRLSTSPTVSSLDIHQDLPEAHGYMSSAAFDFTNPAIRIQQSSPAHQPPFTFSAGPTLTQDEQHSGVGNWLYGGAAAQGGNMMANSAMQQALSQSTRHRRIPSSSSAGSASPASPYSQPLHNQTYSSHLPTPTQTPTQDSFISSSQPHFNTVSYDQMNGNPMTAHLAMKSVFGDGGSVGGEEAPGFSPARHSVSSYGRNSPATPRTVSGDDFNDDFRVPHNGENRAAPVLAPNPATQKVEDWIELYLRFDSDTDALVRPHVVPKFDRSNTDMYADTGFDPTSQPMAMPAQRPVSKANQLLSPFHASVMEQRLAQANQARSLSPSLNGGSRGVSPFREGSRYAHISNNTRLPMHAPRHNTQAQAQSNAMVQRPGRRESEPETISPKDSLIEFTEPEDDASKMPLINDSANFDPYVQQQNTSVPMADGRFRPSAFGVGGDASGVSVGGWAGQTSTAFAQPATSATANTVSAAPFSFGASSMAGMFHGLSNAHHNNFAPTSMPMVGDETPEFPVHLTRMESSASEAPPQSSAASTTYSDLPVAKPASTLADTGTYTCTYHGCTQRFETPQKLQRHKRDAHRHQNASSAAAIGITSATPSPVTSGIGSGMTSAALAERNSQAGPHKCERINPTTGKPCNTIFSRPYDLTRHEDTIHNARKQKVRCALCQEEKTFSRSDALTRHMRVVHPDVDFPGKHRRRGGRDD